MTPPLNQASLFPTEKILVIKLGALGDFIMAQGVLTAIRKHHKNAHMTLLTIPSLQDMAEKCGLFDDVVLDNRQKSNIFKIPSLIKDEGFARIYDMQGNSRTNAYYQMLRLLTLGNTPDWCGPAYGATHPRPPHRDGTHRVEWWQDQMKDLGIKPPYKADWKWFAGDLNDFALPKDYALLVTGCAPHRPDKRWQAGNYVDTAKRLLNMGIIPVLIGTEAEAEVNAFIKSQCSLVINLTGHTNLFQIASIAKGAKIAIGNDTGPMHIIGAVGCKTVTVFSKASDPTFIGPKNATSNAKINPYIQVDDLKDLSASTVWDMAFELMQDDEIVQPQLKRL